MDKLCKYIDKELEEMEEKVGMGGKLSRTEIEDGKNLAKFKMALLTNEAMEEDGEYSGNYSGARGRGRNARRDSMGRYSSDGRMMPYYGGTSYDGRMDSRFDRGYSRDDAKAEMMDHLRDLEMSAQDEKTRRMVKEWIRQAERE
jgi:hypothetical protein